MPGAVRPSAWLRAARTRWVSRIAFVSGPTPPGTGVIAEATRDGRLEVDVADEAALDDVDADVDDDAAGLEHLAGDEAGPPGRDHDDVRLAQVAPRGRACFEWQIVTVACSRRSRNAAGLPDDVGAADDDGALALRAERRSA